MKRFFFFAVAPRSCVLVVREGSGRARRRRNSWPANPVPIMPAPANLVPVMPVHRHVYQNAVHDGHHRAGVCVLFHADQDVRKLQPVHGEAYTGPCTESLIATVGRKRISDRAATESDHFFGRANVMRRFVLAVAFALGVATVADAQVPFYNYGNYRPYNYYQPSYPAYIVPAVQPGASYYSSGGTSFAIGPGYTYYSSPVFPSRCTALMRPPLNTGQRMGSHIRTASRTLRRGIIARN